MDWGYDGPLPSARRLQAVSPEARDMILGFIAVGYMALVTLALHSVSSDEDLPPEDKDEDDGRP